MANKRRRRRRPGATTVVQSSPTVETPQDQPDGANDVGYGKPPRNSRFQPGQSGNPKGRPRGSKNFATLIEKELSAKVAVTEGGKRRVLPKRALIAKRIVNKAAEGDNRSLQTLLKLQETAGADPGSAAGEHKTLGPGDQAILDAFENSLKERLGGTDPKSGAADTPSPETDEEDAP